MTLTVEEIRTLRNALATRLRACTQNDEEIKACWALIHKLHEVEKLCYTPITGTKETV